MKKGGVILILIGILLINSISFANAGWFSDVWSKITGKAIEENVTLEPEPTLEPKNITEPKVVCSADVKECSDGSFVSRNSDNNCEFYPCPLLPGECADKERGCGGPCSPCSKEECKEGETKNYICPDGIEIHWCLCSNAAWVCKISPENACPQKSRPEPKPEPEPPPYEVETCAAKIKITLDKNIYYYGDIVKVRVEISDAEGNGLANYPFDNKIYTYSDGLWHTVESSKTDKNGLFVNNEGRIEKGKQPLGKIKIKVSTAPNIKRCSPVEDNIEIEIRGGEKKEEVCGIGVCVPEERKKVEEIPKEKILYSCMGCELEKKCYPIAYRKAGQYCTPNYEFVNQIEEGKCENNFECKSNVCISGECVGESLMKKIINWFNKLFGREEKEEELKSEADCSKLLIEKDIKDFEYNQSVYGNTKESQAPLYSDDGKQIGVVKCCVAQYIGKGRNEVAAAMVCPYNNREDLYNSLKWLSARGELVLGEYKGQKTYKVASQIVMVWTNNAYILAVGTGPSIDIQPQKDISNAYFEKYPNDLESIEIPKSGIPYEPKPWVYCTKEDEEAVKKCLIRSGSKLQTDPHPEKDCEVYVGCILSDEPIKYQDYVKEFLIKAKSIGEVILIDFETLYDGSVLQNGDKLTGKEWESLGVVFETPSEEYLKVFGPNYPFNPLDKLSLSPGLGPFESGSDTHDDLNIIFSEPVKAAGIYLLDLGETDERESVTFLDKNKNVIEKISPWPKSTFGNPAPGTFVSLIHKEGISKIEILENTRDSDDIAYDNLYFVR